MSNYLVLEINIDRSIGDMNGNQNQATKQDESINACINLLAQLVGGNISGSVKVVSKDAATTINTSGTGSASNTFSF